jgi:hypothetical protein
MSIVGGVKRHTRMLEHNMRPAARTFRAGSFADELTLHAKRLEYGKNVGSLKETPL